MTSAMIRVGRGTPKGTPGDQEDPTQPFTLSTTLTAAPLELDWEAGRVNIPLFPPGFAAANNPYTQKERKFPIWNYTFGAEEYTMTWILPEGAALLAVPGNRGSLGPQGAFYQLRTRNGKSKDGRQTVTVTLTQALTPVLEPSKYPQWQAFMKARAEALAQKISIQVDNK